MVIGHTSVEIWSRLIAIMIEIEIYVVRHVVYTRNVRLKVCSRHHKCSIPTYVILQCIYIHTIYLLSSISQHNERFNLLCMYYGRVHVLFTYSGVQYILCCVLLWFSSSCVPHVASFSGLSFFDCSFGIL